MLKRILYLALSGIVAVLIWAAKLQLSTNAPTESDDLDEVKVSRRSKREPASTINLQEQQLYKPAISDSSRKSSDFAPRVEVSQLGKEDQGGGGRQENDGGLIPYAADNGAANSSPSRSRAPSNTNSNINPTKNPLPPSGLPPNQSPYGPPLPSPELKDLVIPEVETPTDNTSSDSSNLSCTSNIGGGAYSNLISVALSCSGLADIEYCLGVGSCCDPQSSGTSFTTNVVIGMSDGAYCLSFYGTSSSGKISSVVQINYNIINDLPHLEASHEQIYYQTTELAGVSHIASDDFGKSNYGVGVLNLMTNDPGPSGMNIDCDEIVTNYVTFPAPATSVVLSFFDTSGNFVTSQLDVPLVLADLGYGENFITTYIINNNTVVPLYSCSTTKVNLEDFEYFQANISHGDDGTNLVREFSGGFSPYGFFESGTTVYRGPAGESSQNLGGQKLESGLFGVFY